MEFDGIEISLIAILAVGLAIPFVIVLREVMSAPKGG